VQVDPEPDLVSERVDFHGNRSLYVEVRTSHTQLIVQSSSLVEVTRDAANLSILDDRPWDEAVVAGGGSWLETEFLLPSPQVPALAEVRAYAERVFTAGRALGEAVGALVSSIHRDFAYTPGATSVHSTMPELLRRREGVCQDFAHLAVGCLRAVGVPARYVSGYLETEPPPGSRRLEGADASHAWFSVLLPELGWVDLDPTNDQPVDARYVVTAWGRDYSDVPPLKGVIFTEGVSSRMNVAVDVIRHV
jgi:transglutaminase-like putative cysteine protease